MQAPYWPIIVGPQVVRECLTGIQLLVCSPLIYSVNKIFSALPRLMSIRPWRDITFTAYFMWDYDRFLLYRSRSINMEMETSPSLNKKQSGRYCKGDIHLESKICLWISRSAIPIYLRYICYTLCSNNIIMCYYVTVIIILPGIGVYIILEQNSANKF